jgi:hypothetical protein
MVAVHEMSSRQYDFSRHSASPLQNVFPGIIFLNAVDGEIRTQNFTKVAVNAFRSIDDLRRMIAFFVDIGRQLQYLSRTVSDAEAAAFTAFPNNNDLAQIDPGGIQIQRLSPVFSLFWHVTHLRSVDSLNRQVSLPDRRLIILSRDFAIRSVPRLAEPPNLFDFQVRPAGSESTKLALW